MSSTGPDVQTVAAQLCPRIWELAPRALPRIDHLVAQKEAVGHIIQKGTDLDIQEEDEEEKEECPDKIQDIGEAKDTKRQEEAHQMDNPSWWRASWCHHHRHLRHLREHQHLEHLADILGYLEVLLDKDLLILWHHWIVLASH